MIHELQLEGLPGPTWFFGGLSPGNVASTANAGRPSHPRAAALACVGKWRVLLELGLPVGFLPPLRRPDAEFLARCGHPTDPALIAIAASSAFAWTANAATVAPSADVGQLRLVPANLVAMSHRALESAGRMAQLRRFLPLAQVTEPLPGVDALADEGAANHTRLRGPAGICHLFIHGRGGDPSLPHRRHRPRQTLGASQAVQRLLCLDDRLTLHARQHPDAVDAGAFHNDVVMVGAGDRVLVHARAWVDQPAVLAELQRRCGPLRIAEIAEAELPLDDAIACYLFNSILVQTAQGWSLIAPGECADGRARQVVDRLLAEGFIHHARFVALRESMMGGGGPACLRLRIPLTDAELAAVHLGIRVDAEACTWIEEWIRRHYRERLLPTDLGDPQLAGEAAAGEQEMERWIAARPDIRTG